MENEAPGKTRRWIATHPKLWGMMLSLAILLLTLLVADAYQRLLWGFILLFLIFTFLFLIGRAVVKFFSGNGE